MKIKWQHVKIMILWNHYPDRADFRTIDIVITWFLSKLSDSWDGNEKSRGSMQNDSMCVLDFLWVHSVVQCFNVCYLKLKSTSMRNCWFSFAFSDPLWRRRRSMVVSHFMFDNKVDKRIQCGLNHVLKNDLTKAFIAS